MPRIRLINRAVICAQWVEAGQVLELPEFELPASTDDYEVLPGTQMTPMERPQGAELGEQIPTPLQSEFGEPVLDDSGNPVLVEPARA